MEKVQKEEGTSTSSISTSSTPLTPMLSMTDENRDSCCCETNEKILKNFPLRCCPAALFIEHEKPNASQITTTSIFLNKIFPTVDGSKNEITFENLANHIDSQVTQLSESYKPPVTADGYFQNPDEGRIGPTIVRMDRSSCGLPMTNCKFTDDTLSLESHGNFISCRANTCVFQGKWIYEVTLGTAGIQQLGWATRDCSFTPQNGVGDAPNSYAYDGKRKRLWNVGAISYGSAWVPGDIIGCGIDVDKGEIEYFRNGKSMGVACKNVVQGPGIGYFPTVSLSRTERCRMNFGATMMAHSCSYRGYRPLQSRDSAHVQDYLMTATRNIIMYKCIDTVQIAEKDIVFAFATAHVLERIAHYLIQPFCSSLMTWFLSMLGCNGFFENHITHYCEMLATLEEATLDLVVSRMFEALAHGCETKSPWCGGATYVNMAAEVLENKIILASWLRQPSRLFDKQLEGLLTVKLAGQDDRDEVLPFVHWESSDLGEENQIKYETRLSQLKKHFSEMEKGQTAVLRVLIDQKLLTSSVTGGIKRSPFLFFKQWLGRLLKLNVCLQRNTVPPGMSDHTVLTSVQGAMMRLFVEKVGIGCPQLHSDPVAVSTWLEERIHNRVFVDDVLCHNDFQRVGGVLSHVRREYSKSVEAGDVEEEPSNNECTLEFELLSRSVLMFDLSLTQPYRRLQQAYSELARALRDEKASKQRLEKARARANDNGAVDLLTHADQVFRDATKENVQCKVLLELAYLGPDRHTVLVTWLDCIDVLLLRMHKLSHFTFVPEALLYAAIQTFNIMGVKGSRATDKEPFFVTSEYRKGILFRFVTLMVTLVADKRIVTPDLSGSILLCIKSILGVVPYLRCIETNLDLCRDLQMSLLQCYNGRLWVLATDIMVRFSAGQGFAFHACSSALDNEEECNTDCASLICQKEFTEICESKPDTVNTFLNQLINNVNMTASEFDQALEMIRKADDSISEDGHEYYRRCLIMFEVTVNLLRLLEATCQNGEEKFRCTSKSSMTLERVVALLLHMIDRINVSSLYDGVMAAHSTLANLKKELLLCPIYGTLMQLAVCNSSEGEEGMITKDNYLVQVIKKNGRLKPEYLEKDNVIDLNSMKGVKPSEVEKIHTFVSQLKLILESEDEEEEEDVDDDLLCTICYSLPLNVTLKPCNHRSCGNCIERHLLNETKCFFCNTVVDSVEKD